MIVRVRAKSLFCLTFAALCIGGQIVRAVSLNTDHLISPGKSVGKVALGMSRAQVHELLKEPTKSYPAYDEYKTKSGKNFLGIWFTEQQQVCEIIFTSPSFQTASGVSIKNFDDYQKQFNLSRLKWRFLNLRYLLKRGGFAIYDLNADSPSENTDYPRSVVGVVFEGNLPPEPILSIDDSNNLGWQSWDGKGEHLYDGLKDQDAGTIGTDLKSR